MKKKCIPLTLAFLMAVSQAMPAFGAEASGEWLTGWTGKAGSTEYSVDGSGDSFVLANNKVNNGKFTDGEDSIIYAAKKISGEEDFTFSATVSIDEYSVMAESSNPQQGSVGIAVLDDLFNKTDDIAYTDSLFLGSYAPDKKSDMAIYPIIRDNSDKKTVGDALSDTFKNEGENLGEFELKIEKSGNMYTFTCGEKSYSAEVYNFDGDIYPALYIARNAKASFKNVKIEIADRRPVKVEIKDAQTEYYYGQALKPVTALVTYSDGTTAETSELSVKGYKPETVGKQKLTVSAGAAKTRYTVTVKPRTVKTISVDYTPVKTKYAKNGVFNSTGMQVSAVYEDGSSEVLDNDSVNIKLGGKTVKDGDILPTAGKLTAFVTRKDEKGVKSGKAVARFDVEVSPKTVTSLEIKPPAKTKYYVGDELDLAGIIVTAHYSDGSAEILDKNEYKVSGFDSDFEEKKLSIAVDPVSGGTGGSFDISVQKRSAQKLVVTKYPKTTYAIGDKVETELSAAVEYDNGDLEKTDAYTVDASAVDTSQAGEYTVTVRPNDGKLSPVSIKVNVEEAKEHFWRKSTFGQSSGYNDAEKTGVSADEYGTVNGKINVRSWGGAGKITADHDGMTYYYTQVTPDENFTLSADITVNKYLEHDNDDTKRNGQEAFGIMVRDAVPLTGTDGGQTVSEDAAKKDEQGVSLPLEGSKVFASNIAILGGYSGTGWPSDTSDPSYEKKTKLNRINLLVRQGVETPDGGGTRIGPTALSETFPAEGSKYRLTMQKLNGGLYVSCYDYQTEKTKEDFYYDDSFLATQTPQSYVGFFTARWADIDVENVTYYTGSKAYSQSISAKADNKKTPVVQVLSSEYTTNNNYTLELKAEDSAKGRVTVKLNDAVVLRDADMEKTLSLNVKLHSNAANRFTVLYTPDDTQALTDYTPIVLRHTVYQKNLNKSLSTIYAAPNGSFNGDGTKEKPLDIYSAAGFVAEGQTAVLTEGTYKMTKPLEIARGNDGKPGALKTLKADGKVVLDYQGEYAGAVISGNYWHIQGIDFTNCGPNLKCVHLGGSSNIIEDCKFYNNQDMGLQISRTNNSDDRRTWPSNNRIVNCEAYNNCDPSKINADGFGAKLTVGEGNVFKGCKSHHNVDDGWDLYTKTGTGAIGAVTLEDCVSYKNGIRLNEDGSETSYEAGGNNGFKLGGENVAVAHRLINCQAYDNMHNGITTNSNPALVLENVKSYNNAAANIRLYSDKPEDYAYTVKGIVSYGGGEPDVIATVTEDTNYKNNSDTPLLSPINYFDLDGTGGKNSLGERAGK